MHCQHTEGWFTLDVVGLCKAAIPPCLLCAKTPLRFAVCRYGASKKIYCVHYLFSAQYEAIQHLALSIHQLNFMGCLCDITTKLIPKKRKKCNPLSSGLHNCADLCWIAPHTSRCSALQQLVWTSTENICKCTADTLRMYVNAEMNSEHRNCGGNELLGDCTHYWCRWEE